MQRYNKAIAALVLGLLTVFFQVYGERLGLDSDWPGTMTALLTPIIVYLIPNIPSPEDCAKVETTIHKTGDLK